ncbi:MAG: hypothetical protein JWO38_8341 [Gemmataceae bacterium]|nr:hypothetical protein [Gemmataceae bacterium]
MSFALTVQNLNARHALLREAARRGWSPQRVRFEAQSRYPTNRRGVGGRPRKPARGLDPEGVLRELGRLTDRWVEFHAQVLGCVGPEEWVGLARAPDSGRRAALRALVRTAEMSLRDLERAGRAARATVGEVGRALGPRG